MCCLTLRAVLPFLIISKLFIFFLNGNAGGEVRLFVKGEKFQINLRRTFFFRLQFFFYIRKLSTLSLREIYGLCFRVVGMGVSGFFSD